MLETNSEIVVLVKSSAKQCRDAGSKLDDVKRLAALKHVDDLLRVNAEMMIQQSLIIFGSVFVLVISREASSWPHITACTCKQAL